jgi:methionyl-tRNA formyltransferase
MLIEPELDSGPILLQRKTFIGEDETAPQVMIRLADMGAELLSETLKRLDDITPQLQRHAEASFAPLLKRSDGLIDWSKDAFAIACSVRGFQPWPNAFTHLDSHRIVIWRATPKESNSEAGIGEVIRAHGDELVVKCGSKTELQLQELQPEAKRRMSVRDFLNGTHLQSGARFQ